MCSCREERVIFTGLSFKKEEEEEEATALPEEMGL